METPSSLSSIFPETVPTDTYFLPLSRSPTEPLYDQITSQDYFYCRYTKPVRILTSFRRSSYLSTGSSINHLPRGRGPSLQPTQVFSPRRNTTPQKISGLWGFGFGRKGGQRNEVVHRNGKGDKEIGPSVGRLRQSNYQEFS